ncbi:hypothetical protein HN011_003624 [Eciton burchellii]|nr:hypothetical protein HN011_003624 [Eciton burchellii]
MYRDKDTTSTHFHLFLSVSVNGEHPRDVPRSDLAAAYFSLDRRSRFNDDSSSAPNSRPTAGKARSEKSSKRRRDPLAPSRRTLRGDRVNARDAIQRFTCAASRVISDDTPLTNTERRRRRRRQITIPVSGSRATSATALGCCGREGVTDARTDLRLRRTYAREPGAPPNATHETPGTSPPAAIFDFQRLPFLSSPSLSGALSGALRPYNGLMLRDREDDITNH